MSLGSEKMVVFFQHVLVISALFLTQTFSCLLENADGNLFTITSLFFFSKS